MRGTCASRYLSINFAEKLVYVLGERRDYIQDDFTWIYQRKGSGQVSVRHGQGREPRERSDLNYLTRLAEQADRDD